MEYQFIHDPASGLASAKFSMEHEVIGPWLENELGHDTAKLTEILTAIDDVEHAKKRQVTIVGHEYSIVIDDGDVVVQNNASMNGYFASVPDELAEELHDFDQASISRCGLDDFRQLILSWSQFTQ